MNYTLSCVYVYRKKHSIYRVWYYPQFQASAGGLGTYPPRIRALLYIEVSHFSNSYSHPFYQTVLLVVIVILSLVSLLTPFICNMSLPIHPSP